MYYVYIIRCKDNSLYTGITNNLERRINQHLTKDKNCAKYTKNHIALKLEIAWTTEDRKLASKLEYRIKRLNKTKKEEIIIDNKKFYDYLYSDIDVTKYSKIL